MGAAVSQRGTRLILGIAINLMGLAFLAQRLADGSMMGG